jgi:hypothetical protein
MGRLFIVEQHVLLAEVLDAVVAELRGTTHPRTVLHKVLLAAPGADVPSERDPRHALSASSLSQALIPLGLALRLYDAFSCAVQRKCTCSVAFALVGRGGLPRRLGWFMGLDYEVHKKDLQSLLGHDLMSTH